MCFQKLLMSVLTCRAWQAHSRNLLTWQSRPMTCTQNSDRRLHRARLAGASQAYWILSALRRSTNRTKELCAEDKMRGHHELARAEGAVYTFAQLS